jgi:hypothetical protein
MMGGNPEYSRFTHRSNWTPHRSDSAASKKLYREFDLTRRAAAACKGLPYLRENFLMQRTPDH